MGHFWAKNGPFWGVPGVQKIAIFEISRKRWGVEENTRRPKLKPLGPSITLFLQFGKTPRLARDMAHFRSFWAVFGPKRILPFGAILGSKKSKIFEKNFLFLITYFTFPDGKKFVLTHFGPALDLFWAENDQKWVKNVQNIEKIFA